MSVYSKDVLISEYKIDNVFEYAFSGCEKLYCNYGVGSDIYPHEVIEVRKGGKELLIREMDAKCNEAYTDNWTCYSNESNPTFVVKLYKNGEYGTKANDKNYSICTEPVKHYDWEF